MDSTIALTGAFNSLDNTRDICKDGDTILTLEDPDQPFAVGKMDSDNPSSVCGSDTEASDKLFIRFRVCSRHLTNASLVFKAALTGQWKESTKSESGYYEITAQGWDTEAFEMALNVIHNKTAKVPRWVSLETLGKIAGAGRLLLP